jgi:IS5 family transposase
MKNKQVTLTGTGFEKFSQTTRRAQFLAEMERVVPWAELCTLVEPVYPKGEGGRPTIRFNLGDPAVEEALYDVVSMREFAGIDLNEEAPPDETTVCKFRHLLERNHLGTRIFQEVGRYLQSQGLRVSSARSWTRRSSVRPARPRMQRASATRRCTRRGRARTGTSA